MLPQEEEEHPNGREVGLREELLLRHTFSSRGEITPGMCPSRIHRVYSMVCEMEAVCKTDPGNGELWEVAHRGKGLPWVTDTPVLSVCSCAISSSAGIVHDDSTSSG